MNHNWSAMKQHLHPQSVAEIRRHSVLSGDRIRHSKMKQWNNFSQMSMVIHTCGIRAGMIPSQKVS